MKNNDWLSSIYSDGSKYFVSNPLPARGEKITISAQVSSDSPVKAVFFQGKFNGVSNPQKMEKLSSQNGLDRYSISVTIYEKEINYFFIFATDEKLYYYTQKEISSWIPNEAYNFRILSDYSQPEWVKNAVFYQIFPERFCNGNPENDVKDGEYTFDGYKCKKIKDWNQAPEHYEKAHCLDFYGGDLEGIRQKIPYLKKLGITALYINPIFYAATVHKYDCLDYFHVDPHFGGDKALEELSEEVHKNGMKIILDVSINHTGIANRWFNKDGIFFPKSEGAYNNPQSEERSYYFFNDDNSYKAWFDVDTLPTLNYTSSELRNKIFLSEDSLVKKWLKAPYSTDGWRFDVADTMARNNEIQLHHEIWPLIRKSIKDVNPQAYILAEDWSDCSEFENGDEWDSPMNYYASCRPVRQFYGQQDVFVGKVKEFKDIHYKMTAEDLVNQISGYLARLPYSISQVQFNLIDSHDLPRFHNDSNMDWEKIRGALTMIFTLPGAANVYYGDEAEIDGFTEEMEGCRFPMPWSKNIEECKSYKFYQKLIEIKTSRESFKDGSFKILYAKDYCLSWARFTPSEAFISVFSSDTKALEIELPLNFLGKNLRKERIIEKDALGEKVKAEIKDEKLKIYLPEGKSYLIEI